MMDGEPHLGYQVESELIVDREEVIALIADEVADTGFVPSIVQGCDDYSEEDIEIETSDWVDDTTKANIEEWITALFEKEEYPDREEVIEYLEKMM
ncbi:MAG: hypothetical protein DRN17_05355 [Thermoplasmata archaeon]|nr:MAG: hypothetical protein DRN17_05355 [Thermoplasmata archaeon]